MTNNIELTGIKQRSSRAHVIELVKSQIASKKILPGEKLPPIRELGKVFGVGNYSVRQAFSQLTEEGVLDTIHGLGTFVTQKPLSIASDAGTNKTRAFCIASAFCCKGLQVELSHPVTLSAMLEECKALGIKGRLLSPNINTLSSDEIIEEIKDRRYDGLIWLYPTSEHWPVIKALQKANNYVAVTSHSQYQVDLPAVQGNEVGAGQRIGQELAKEGFNKIIILSYEEQSEENIRDVRSGLHTGMKIGLLNAFEEASVPSPKLVYIKYNYDDYIARLIEASSLLDERTCLIIANKNEFRDYFKKDLERFIAMFKGHKLIISTSQSEYHSLDELAARMDFSVLVYPYERIGRAVVHKLNNCLDGKFEDTTTLVNGVFEKFNMN